MKCGYIALLALATVFILISIGTIGYVFYTEYHDQYSELVVSDAPPFTYVMFYQENKHQWMDRIVDLQTRILPANVVFANLMKKVWTRLILVFMANVVIMLCVVLCFLMYLCSQQKARKAENVIISEKPTDEIKSSSVDLSMETSGIYDTPWVPLVQPIPTVVETEHDYETVYTPTPSEEESRLMSAQSRSIVLFFPENF